MKHANISVFVPHVGCSGRCVFCNQNSITGAENTATINDVETAMNRALATKNYDPQNTEIAFFGGSFTAINREYMISLLEVGHRYVLQNLVKGIRISTRPDAIDNEILNLLSNYGVTAIEIGAQSMSDRVLKHNLRGHTSEDIRKACGLISERGFELGLQMMTGMYCSDCETDIVTARKIIQLNPKTVRIYPTITIKNTALEQLYNNGEYKPPTLEETVELCAELVSMFEEEGISVIRLGLHTMSKDDYVAGPWHPAIGELCENRRILNRIIKIFDNKSCGCYSILVNPSDVSKFAGHHRCNLEKLKELGFDCKIKQDKYIDKNTFRIKKV